MLVSKVIEFYYFQCEFLKLVKYRYSLRWSFIHVAPFFSLLFIYLNTRLYVDVYNVAQYRCTARALVKWWKRYTRILRVWYITPRQAIRKGPPILDPFFIFSMDRSFQSFHYPWIPFHLSSIAYFYSLSRNRKITSLSLRSYNKFKSI